MRFKRPLFAFLAVVLFFGTIEILLWGAGVKTLRSERDPWNGFSHDVRVFEADEQTGVYRTALHATEHSFNYQEFSLAKPAEGLRVFVIGGSSAFGFPWGAGRAFPRVLGQALSATAPDRVVESINAAAMSYGSHRLRRLVPELLEYDPDVLIVFSGHNEYVERDLQARLAEQGNLSGIRRTLSMSRLYSTMTRGYESLTGNGSEVPVLSAGSRTTAELLGLTVYDREPAENVVSAQRAEVLAGFEKNLSDILRLARRAGVAVVLCTVPSNLSGWVPNQSLFGADVGLEGRGRVQKLVADARSALEAEVPDAALATLLEAQEIAPAHAATQFWLGRTYQRLGRFDLARQAYTRARDEDARPSRAETAINATIRNLGLEYDVPVADVEQAFQKAAPEGLVGFNLFEDYVHPKPAAHRRVAFELWNVFVEERLGGSPAVPEEQRQPVFEKALGRPLEPVSDSVEIVDADVPVANPSMLFNLAVVLENQGLIERAMEKYNACLQLHPSYYLARENLARLLFKRGDFAEAARAYRGVLNDDPRRIESLIGLGESLRRLGQTAQALEVLQRAVAMDPTSIDGHNSLGGTLAQLNRHAEAETAFRRAVALDPGEPDTHVNLGLSLLFQQQIDEAADAFQAALALSPHDLRARNGMGAVLTERGDLESAERIFRDNLEVAPGDPFATSGLQIIETKRRGEQ